MRRGSPAPPDERGSITFFGIGMVIVLVFVGGISTDLWRAFSQRRALSELADAAAAAGANGIDVGAYRENGLITLDPGLAEQLAWESLAGQVDQDSVSQMPLVVASPSVVMVEVRGRVEFTLLQIFAPGEPFEITVVAEAAPSRGLDP